MSDTRTNFYYDPIRQGYDSNSWRTLSGAPSVIGGRISVDNQSGVAGSAIHYADFVKGEVSFNVNVPVAPTEGIVRMFGLSAPNKGAHIYFKLTDSFNCETSDGTNTTTSSDITWESAWTGANVLFTVRWEAGRAKFFVNGTRVYDVSDNSVPYGPLSLYIFDNADSSMRIGDIDVTGAQTYEMHLKTDDTTVSGLVGSLSLSQAVSIAENITLKIPSLKIPYSTGSMFEGLTVSENLAFQMGKLFPSTIVESIALTENLSFLFDKWLFIPVETVAITENITLEKVSY